MKFKLMLVLLAALLAVGMVGVSAPAARADDTVYTEGTLYYTIANESITIIGYFGRDAEVHVPAMIAGIPVNTIAAGAFAENEYVKTVYLPDTISKVEPGAFGAWVHVIYNANTDHPQDTPTDLILGLLTPAASDSPEATEPPADPADTSADPAQPPAPPAEGSGTEEDTEPDPTATPKPAATQKPTATSKPATATATPGTTAAPGDEEPGTVFGEDDVDDEEDSKEEATPEPTQAPMPELTEAPVTEAPKATDAPKVAEAKATDAPVKTEPTATAEPAPVEKSGSAGWIWGAGAAAVVIAGAALLLKKRKKA